MDSPNQRISKVIEYSGLSSSEFADSVDVQRSSVSHITSGRNKPSLEFIIKIKNRFPELNWDWLILGDGEMLAKNNTQEAVPGIQQQASPPDLFSIIDDENFGKTNEITPVGMNAPREVPKPATNSGEKPIAESQPLADDDQNNSTAPKENQQNKLKRIVMFFENGKFESFEP